MGKKAKAKAKEKRAARKRAIKQANKAKYAKWRELGMNQKSKRARNNSKKKKVNTMKGINPQSKPTVPTLRKRGKVLSITETRKYLVKLYPDKAPKPEKRGGTKGKARA